MFFDNKVKSHSLVMGASGKGKSVLSEQVRKNARLRGDLLVDMVDKRVGGGGHNLRFCARVMRRSDERLFQLISPATLASVGAVAPMACRAARHDGHCISRP